jgi:hypothetical protein
VRGTPGEADSSLKVVGVLAVIGDVEAFDLGLFRCPQANRQVSKFLKEARE